ncbi:SDR family NAD(P)-dependent oxidoreductase [Halothiobacillus sp.]|uniref:SDR family NAD(P)-dependent oxidoreductase n=1 Tax=Halothiobacillus sp. TaxID=1891311 RepID=UPI003D0F8E6D|nr:SDR family NAD(P)-dependent oxidoreductase [Halothiobacillaceae bacterium]
MSLQAKNIAVFGASSAVAQAMINQLTERFPKATVHAFSRQGDNPIDYLDESALAAAAERVTQTEPLDFILIANGILHDDQVAPEKALGQLSAANFEHVFEINTIIPALIAKHFLPKLNRQSPAYFVALSARVGSISDNRLGGWYAYRASKAALNMLIRTAAIEVARRNKQAVVVALEPGTVDTALSKPFQNNVPAHKLFTPDQSAEHLLSVLDQLTPEQSGRFFGWDGHEIQP